MFAVRLLLLLALEPSTEGAGGRVPPLAIHSAPHAADHVAVVEFSSPSQPVETFRQEVKRSGTWLRVDWSGARGRQSVFSDFRSKTSVSRSIGADGGLTGVTIERHPPSDTYNLYRRARTGARDEALGERCEVWRTARSGRIRGSLTTAV